MLNTLGSVGIFLAAYNITVGLIYRMANNNEGARACGLEASIWFVAACICFK